MRFRCVHKILRPNGSSDFKKYFFLVQFCHACFLASRLENLIKHTKYEFNNNSSQIYEHALVIVDYLQCTIIYETIETLLFHGVGVSEQRREINVVCVCVWGGGGGGGVCFLSGLFL